MTIMKHFDWPELIGGDVGMVMDVGHCPRAPLVQKLGLVNDRPPSLFKKRAIIATELAEPIIHDDQGPLAGGFVEGFAIEETRRAPEAIAMGNARVSAIKLN